MLEKIFVFVVVACIILGFLITLDIDMQVRGQRGDLNADGKKDITDLSILAAQINDAR